MEKSFSARVQEARAAVSSVTARQARGARGVFVDPRPADVIRSTTGIIPGAINVPLGDIAQGRLPRELADRDQEVITACQAGPMGAVAAHELAKLGFRNVRYMDGGTQAWLDAGFVTSRGVVAPRATSMGQRPA